MTEGKDAKTNVYDKHKEQLPVWMVGEIAEMELEEKLVDQYAKRTADSLIAGGMVLWALAEEEDEPETKERPLTFSFTSPRVVSRTIR